MATIWPRFGKVDTRSQLLIYVVMLEMSAHYWYSHLQKSHVTNTYAILLSENKLEHKQGERKTNMEKKRTN